MKCSKVRGLLSEYLVGDLSKGTTRNIGIHLATCLDCRGEMRRFRQILSELRSLAAVTPQGLLAEFRRRLESKQAAIPPILPYLFRALKGALETIRQRVNAVRRNILCENEDSSRLCCSHARILVPNVEWEMQE